MNAKKKQESIHQKHKDISALKDVRAVLLATGYRPELEPLVHYRPVPLFRILDKPMIEHIIEFLVRQGVRHCDIILSHLPYKVETLLEAGSRWGIHINYHLAKNPARPFLPLFPVIDHWKEEKILLGTADTLPNFHLESLLTTYGEGPSPTLLLYPSKEWTGWCLISKEKLKLLPHEFYEEDFTSYFKPSQYRIEKALPFLSIRSLLDYQKTNFKLLSLKSVSQHFPITARMIEPGVWISRATTIHPSARIRGPVFIGENCQIKQHAQIGPYVVIENNSVIENKSIVEDALICQRSYVGEGLEVRHSIIDRNILINLALETHVVIHDDFILAELKAPSFRQYLLRSLGRYFAVVLIVIFSPILGVLYLTRNIQKNQMLLLPSAWERHRWKTFDLMSFTKNKKHSQKIPKGFFACLPMLINVINGELHFTGVSPRSPEEVEQLPPDWRNLYLKSKAGLITLAMLEQGGYSNFR